MTVVAILTVRREALEQFRAFERGAAAVMDAHGGRIERTVVVTPDRAPGLVTEIHVVTFPDATAFQAYRDDARLGALAPLRAASVVGTELYVGEDGPDYRDAVAAVTLAAYAEYAPQMPELWEAYRANILGTLADPRPAAQIVAERDGALVGAVLLYPTGAVLPGGEGSHGRTPWPEVRLLAVAPAARGPGVGAARAAGAPALALHTTDLMRVAIRLYERLGFVRAPELDVQVAPALVVSGYRLDLG